MCAYDGWNETIWFQKLFTYINIFITLMIRILIYFSKLLPASWCLTRTLSRLWVPFPWNKNTSMIYLSCWIVFGIRMSRPSTVHLLFSHELRVAGSNDLLVLWLETYLTDRTNKPRGIGRCLELELREYIVSLQMLCVFLIFVWVSFQFYKIIRR